PLWVFHRGDARANLAESFAGQRIAVEPEGSGTRVLFRKMLEINGIPDTSLDLRALSPDEGAEAMLRDEVDVVVTLTSWRSPAVTRLLNARGVTLDGFPRADAYVA